MKRLTQELSHLLNTIFQISNFNFNLSTRRYIYYSRDQLTNKLSTMALRRPPTRIELKADDVEEYDKVSNGQQWFIILLAFYKLKLPIRCAPRINCICLPAYYLMCITQYLSLIFICHTSLSNTHRQRL